jgi:hypothetical protein
MKLINNHFWKFFIGVFALMAAGFFVVFMTEQVPSGTSFEAQIEEVDINKSE